MTDRQTLLERIALHYPPEQRREVLADLAPRPTATLELILQRERAKTTDRNRLAARRAVSKHRSKRK